MIEILSKVANVIRNPRFDAWLENREQAKDLRAYNKRIAKALAQANSVIAASKKKSTYF